MGGAKSAIMATFRFVVIGVALTFGWVSPATAQRCDIPREARDTWHCENGFVIGPENVIIRLPIPETDPEALYNAGVEAAQREDWRVAIAYFTAAHQRAHLVPKYMYNLGLAHARAGHHVAAIGWLSAYLVAQPAAPNRTSVWQQIGDLEASASRDIDVIWNGASQAAAALPATPYAPALPGAGNPRSSAYMGLATRAASANDLSRARHFVELERAAIAYTPSDPPGSIEDELQAFRPYARSIAIRYYDRANVERLNVALASEPSDDGEREQLRRVLQGTRPRLEWNWPSNYYRGYVLDAVDSGNRQGYRTITGEPTSFHLAAMGEADAALRAARTARTDGWFGPDNIGLEATRVSEVLLLAGDAVGARRALALAQQYLPSSNRHFMDIIRVQALLAAEQGHADAGFAALDVAASELNALGGVYSGDGNRCCIGLGETLSPDQQWNEFRFYPVAQIASFLFWRSRTAEALNLVDRLDSLRALGMLNYGDSVAQTAAEVAAIQQARARILGRASGGEFVTEERRAAIEDAIVTARRLPGVAYDVDRWIRQAPDAPARSGEAIDAQGRPAAQLQVERLSAAAPELMWGLRLVRVSYERAGGVWGQ